MVKYLKYPAALWAAMFIYCVLSFFNGASGMSAYRQLSMERDRQRANVMSLETEGRELAGEKLALSGDPETIMLRARDLGYGRPEERFIRIVGLQRPAQPRYEAGQPVTIHSPDYLPDETIRLAAIIAGIITLLLLAFCESLKKLLAGPLPESARR